MQALAIQQALLANSYSLGPEGADGIWGRDSIAALKKFQWANGLADTGVPDSSTLQALFGQRTSGPVPSPVWYEEAARLQGLHEAPGLADNPTILGWARQLGGWVEKVYRADSTPWCGLFVSHCISVTLPEERLPANPLSALAWARFGRSLVKPALGAVCVFTRKGGGHVAFYAGEDADTIHTLGGNQSDAVTLTRIPRSRLAAFRWPASAPVPSSGPIKAAATGALSQSEA